VLERLGGGYSPAKPVSTMKFPFIREFNRENPDFQVLGPKTEAKPTYISASCGAIP
jgi:hypothetical protein